MMPVWRRMASIERTVRSTNERFGVFVQNCTLPENDGCGIVCDRTHDILESFKSVLVVSIETGDEPKC